MNKKIAIIGSGNLGTSLVKGLVESGQYNYSDFILTRRNLSKLQELQELGAELESNNSEAVKKAKIVVLAVLPQKINEVLNELKEIYSISLKLSSIQPSSEM